MPKKTNSKRILNLTYPHEKNFKPLALHHYKPYICAVLTKVCKYVTIQRLGMAGFQASNKA